MTRVLSALVLIPLVVAAVLYAPGWLFALLVGGVALAALYEFFRIAAAAQIRCFQTLGYVSGVATVFVLYWNLKDLLPALLIAAVLSGFLVALAVVDDFRQAMASLSATLFGVLYTVFLLGLMIPIRGASFGSGLAHRFIFFPMVVTWAGDIGAYYIGRSLGRHKLAPRISPKKTVEGALGGVAASLLGGYLFHRFWPLPDTAADILILALLIAVFGQLGDAAESLLKRGAALKDSSALIPGHGGVLDRIDSLLFAVPVMYVYLFFFKA